MIQNILIGLLFAGAVFYLGRILFKSFRSTKNGCAGECKCDTKAQFTPKA